MKAVARVHDHALEMNSCVCSPLERYAKSAKTATTSRAQTATCCGGRKPSGNEMGAAGWLLILHHYSLFVFIIERATNSRARAHREEALLFESASRNHALICCLIRVVARADR